MSLGKILRIENNTARVNGLPPTQSFPVGVKLVPGLNTVPVGYMDELEAHEVETAPVNGKTTKRFPGREVIADLQKRVRIVTLNGNTIGPQITVYTDDQAGRDDGPPPPDDLADFKVEIAVKMVEFTSDREALKRWFDREKRKPVKEALASKLGGM